MTSLGSVNSILFSVKVTAEGSCPHCDSTRGLYRRMAHHEWHALVAVLTLGLWTVPWLVVWWAEHRQPWRCRKCRQRVAPPAPLVRPALSTIATNAWPAPPLESVPHVPLQTSGIGNSV